MTRIISPQLGLARVPVDHDHARELQAVSEILDSAPEITFLVEQELLRHGDVAADVGCPGMTSEQVLRSLVIKQMNGYSYEELAFHLADSISYRWFCRFPAFEGTPKKSTLNENIKLLSEETLEAIHRILVGIGQEERIETGRKVRVDCTVTESNIHYPTDASLLFDGVRTLTRLLRELSEQGADIRFSDHTKRAKRRWLEIQNARNQEARVPLYGDLMEVTQWTVNYAREAVSRLMDPAVGSGLWTAPILALWSETVIHYVGLIERVIDQTWWRVIEEKKVPSPEKVVSLFEPHTDVIVKDRRDTLFGHKLCLTTGVSSMVLDCVILEGNPADSSLAVEMIRRQETMYGRPPRQAAFDGGFASRDNLADIRSEGVQDVMFHKKRGLEVSEMAKSTWVYRCLRRFRAGIEGTISFLKRCFGLDRCTWKGYRSFKAYVWSSIISANLLVLARHKLARAVAEAGG